MKNFIGSTMKKLNLNQVPKLMALLVLLFSIGIGEMWGSHYYAKLTASLADGTGTGTVYVATPSTEATEAANDPSAHEASKYATSSDAQNTDFYFTAYATAARGSMFSSWSDLSGDGSPAVYADGGYTLNSNPIIVKVTSASSSGTNEATIKANFVASSETPFDIYFLEPEGVGTYAVSSYIDYPTPVQGGDPVLSYSTDEIKLTATNGEGYGFRRFYYVDAEGKKKTLGEFAQKEQILSLSSEMKNIGCEFVAAWELNYVTATNGSFTAKNGSTALTVDADPATTTTTYADDNITLAATPSTGYAFFRYVGTDAIGNTYTIGTIGLGSQTVNIPQNTVSVTAEFTDKPFIVGTSMYDDLDGAIQATRKNDGTYAGVILLVNNYTVSAGYYTIPAGVTLLIPVDANQLTPRPSIERVNENSKKPTKAYKTLTLASDVHLDVFGAIEVGGRQNSYNNNGQGRPQGDTYGLLDMKSGSTITLENGSNLYAWGFVIGDRDGDDKYLCSIDVRRGACVHEQFQMYDWEGGSEAYAMEGNDKGVFIINEYFIQNVEVAATYRPGSALFTYSGILGEGIDKIKVIGVVGDNAAMFLMDDADDSEDTWVRKSYQPTTDLQVYEINNAAKLGNLEITFTYTIFTIVVNSRDYVLPITHNMKIHLLTGQMDITQNTVMLPGAEIEVDKQSTVVINEGMTLYLFDYHEWDAHIHQGKYAYRAEVRPGGIAAVRDISSAEGLGNAKLNVHGTFIADGLLITTEGGASIHSNDDDAGTVIFNADVPTATPSNKELYVHNYVTRSSNRYYTRPTTPAKLLNGDNSYATTAGTPSGQSYCYLNGKWTMMTVDSDNSCFVYDNYGTYYAKPADYVAINATKTNGVISGNNDHTFSDAAGEGKLYILVDDCQWWEVENVDNLYHCTHPQNDTYYYWNGTKWEEKKFAISWKDYDGSAIKDANNQPIVYYLPYGATPKFNSTNPTRPADVDYTYNFTGWSPAFAPVTGDQSYTATYSKTQIKYTIIFKFVEDINDGAEIDRQQLARDEMPVAPSITPRDGWYIKWTPAIGAVTGHATYEAEWIESLPDNYTITWKNYDGSTLSMTTPARDATAETVLAGAPTNPTKPATSEYRYEFAGWQPTVAAATADAVYTAQYTETGQTYAIRFYKEDGTTQIGETQNLMFGAAPSAPASTKENTVQYTFTRQWKDMSNDVIVGVGVPSVSGDADYKEYFTHTTNRYTISANSEVEGEDGNVAGCTFTGVGTYDYDTDITLTAIPNTGYEFVKWKDNDSTDPAREISVSETTSTYTAIVKPIELTVEIDAQKTIALPTTLAGLTISSNGDEQSSEVLGAENLSFIDGRSAYFDLQIGDIEPRHWHAFSVPFQVNLKKAGKPIQINGEPLTLGRGYDILFYDGAERAAHGKTDDCWKYVEDGDSTLYPGKAYMIASASRAINTVRFTAELDANGKLILADGLTVTAGSGADGGWNGIGNPNMYHSTIIAGPTFGYVHDGGKIGEDGYVEYNIDNLKYVVGKAVYVQVEGSGTQPVVVNKAGGQDVIQPNLAPARRSASAKTNAQYLLLDDYYKISLSNDNGIKGSNVYVLDEKDKENKYVIGHDLAKMSMSNTRAQIWVERYNDKLSLNTTAPIDNQANYPLGIYAPKAGEYTISMPTQIESGKALYLTLDGEAIWNLSDGAYTISLEKGTTNHYGLRISAKAPQMPTDIDEAVVDAKGETQKVLIDNQVFIIRGNEAYTITGKKVN